MFLFPTILKILANIKSPRNPRTVILKVTVLSEKELGGGGLLGRDVSYLQEELGKQNQSIINTDFFLSSTGHRN